MKKIILILIVLSLPVILILLSVIRSPIAQPENEWIPFDYKPRITRVYGTDIETTGLNPLLFDSTGIRKHYDISLTVNVTKGSPLLVQWDEGDTGYSILVFANRSRTIDTCYWDADESFWDENLPKDCRARENLSICCAYAIDFTWAEYSDYEGLNLSYVDTSIDPEGYYKYVINSGPSIAWDTAYFIVGIGILIIIRKNRLEK
jgi:hypothetical protein